METIRLDGRLLAQSVQQKLREELSTLSHIPVLAVVVLGENAASTIYINMKTRAATAIGIKTSIHRFPDTLSTQDVVEVVQSLNKDPSIDGI